VSVLVWRVPCLSGLSETPAVVNLTPAQALGAGFGELVSSDVAAATGSSNVNYRPSTVDPNVAVAQIGADGEVCFINGPTASVHLIAAHLGTIDADSYTPATTSGEPDRKIDTRRP
jgi:hypothetical protein